MLLEIKFWNYEKEEKEEDESDIDKILARMRSGKWSMQQHY